MCYVLTTVRGSVANQRCQEFTVTIMRGNNDNHVEKYSQTPALIRCQMERRDADDYNT